MARADRNTYGNHVACDLTDFASVLDGMLNNIQPVVREAVNIGIKDTAKAASERTRESGTYQNRRPKYRGSISYRISYKEYFVHAQVYARGHEYSLTHLLENGHAIWNKPGRRTRAFPHWKRGEELATEMIVPEIMKHLKDL